MREILFRGKEKDSGKWVYGWLGHFHCHNPQEKTIKSIYFTEITEDHNSKMNIIVDYKTVGQYTGLTDKNGTKIFEGDIIQYYGTYPLEVFTEEGHTKIRWFDSVTKSKCSELFFGGNDEAYGEFEVIGNIHDNPELLKGGVD